MKRIPGRYCWPKCRPSAWLLEAIKSREIAPAIAGMRSWLLLVVFERVASSAAASSAFNAWAATNAIRASRLRRASCRQCSMCLDVSCAISAIDVAEKKRSGGRASSRHLAGVACRFSAALCVRASIIVGFQGNIDSIHLLRFAVHILSSAVIEGGIIGGVDKGERLTYLSAYLSRVCRARQHSMTQIHKHIQSIYIFAAKYCS